MARKSWDQYFMEQAELVSTRATCDRLKVGAVLVKDNRMIATGYNGSISGTAHCDGVGHLMCENGCKRTIHAELNAILQCAKYGVAADGATAYVNHYPCPSCMQALNQSGIKKVVYRHFYKHRYENDFDQGMEVVQFEGDN
ncbi:cytidine/deoxycytidylate deaminase family protein [Bacillus paralicheniformis]|uniref:deoxycytidylate deaminase n=1 Tax=Bacillus paralicheniformis TaxID=1648923 RepID=UPI003D1D849A